MNEILFVLLKEGLQELIDLKMITPLSVEALAHLLSGAMDEAAVWIAGARMTKGPSSRHSKRWSPYWQG